MRVSGGKKCWFFGKFADVVNERSTPWRIRVFGGFFRASEEQGMDSEGIMGDQVNG